MISTPHEGRIDTPVIRVIWMLVLMLAICALCSPADAQMVRYLDDNGNQVISFTLPPERARYGYQIIADDGRVIKEVEAELSPEEYAKKLRNAAALKECETELNRVQRMYESASDVDYARQQEMASIDESIKNTRISVSQLQESLREMETEAARLERSGNSLTSVLMGNITKTKSQIRTLDEVVASREQDKLDADVQYDRHLEVLQRGECKVGTTVATPRPDASIGLKSSGAGD